MTLQEMQEKIILFVTKRDWKQFHNPKDLAISLSLEAGEVLEHFQWKSEEETNVYLKQHKKEVGDELADVFYWVVLMSYYLDVDLEKAFIRKMKQNEKKYPVKKAKGNAAKYTEL